MGDLNPRLHFDGRPRVLATDCGKVVKYSLSDYRPRVDEYGERLPPYYYLRDEDGNVVDRDRYISATTGEIREFERSEVKGDNKDSLKKSFARLRDLINANFDEPSRTLFVTYTYDPKRLERFGSVLDLRKVSKDMRRMFCNMRKSGAVPDFRHIYVVEQQGNGRWHTHCIFFYEEVPPYIEEELLRSWWPHGFVRVSRRFHDGEEILNVGAYICAYLTDVVTDDHKQVKNARLMNYPTNVHLYRCSRNVRRPVHREVDYSEFRDVMPSSETLTYQKVNVHERVQDGRRVWRTYEYLHFARLPVSLKVIGELQENPNRLHELLDPHGNRNNLSYVKSGRTVERM